MPNRVSVKTEDLVGIIDSLTQNINGCMVTLRKEWDTYRSIKSFTQFRNLENTFAATYEQILKALEILREEKERSV